ncbi:hypothetical protein [Virgibacillus sp. 6R]|uniref:hypothetical protein n=1 Tax=Metabacillus sp. 22489 TaxID=3453928 RepID=UPI00164317B4
MKWNLLSIFVLLGTLIMGCSNNGLSGEKPPKATIQIANKSYPTTLGSYCWHSKGEGICADTAGPVELLEGKKPIEVKAGEQITFEMDYEPKPNEIHVSEIYNNKESEVPVENNRFSAPMEKGIYYYSYGTWWMDEKQENVSNGSAVYAFVIEVK